MYPREISLQAMLHKNKSPSQSAYRGGFQSWQEPARSGYYPKPNPSEPSCIATISLSLSCSLVLYSSMSSWLKQVCALGRRSCGPYALWIWSFWGPEIPCSMPIQVFTECPHSKTDGRGSADQFVAFLNGIPVLSSHAHVSLRAGANTE